MHDLVFESTRTVTPKEFAEFVATREAAGDTGHYELLNGRVVMSPPAGYPHGEVGSNVQRRDSSFRPGTWSNRTTPSSRTSGGLRRRYRNLGASCASCLS